VEPVKDYRFYGLPSNRERLMPDDAIGTRGLELAAGGGSIKIATYNIHACIGIDRQYDPARIAAVLRIIDADIACLQEVGARRRIGRHADQWTYLAEATGRHIVRPGVAKGGSAGMRERRPRIGNAILTRLPVLSATTIDLSLPGLAPRSALDADLLVGERILRVIATHLGLSALERRLQASRLIAALGELPASRRRAADAVLVMGDLNEWRGRAGAVAVLDDRLGPSAAPRTFPSWMPMLALDRIYVHGPAAVCDLSVDRSPLARLASDHLPLVGRLYWEALERPARLRRMHWAEPAPAGMAAAPPG
jgi:endonuclease/exonuclease/phosphatase family metal-dependent hydrolase